MKIFYTRIPNLSLFLIFTMICAFVTASSQTVFALPTLQEFDQEPGLVLSDQDFYSLPLGLNSPEKIQQLLVSNGSLLSKLNLPVSLVPDSGVLNEQAFANKPIQYRTPAQLGPYLNRTMSAAEIIWYLARSNMSSSCSLYQSNGVWYSNNICYDGAVNPINPGFIISMIQKESGMIYGTNSKLDPNSSQAQFLLDRIVGYYCFENPDRSKSCYDENPDWIYYKGFFRQLYYATRLLRLREQMCRTGGSSAFSNSNGVFQVGNYVTIDGRSILLKNGISCSMYIYTPHTSSQRLALQIMQELEINKNLIEIKGLPPDYIPVKVYLFDPEATNSDSESNRRNQPEQSNAEKNGIEAPIVTSKKIKVH